MTTLGWHWMAHATGCARDRIDDVEAVRDALAAVVEGLGLRAVSAPTAERTATGVTAVVLLAESHLAVHTLPSTDEAFVDLFSCAPVDGAAAAALIRDQLGATGLSARIVERGA